MKKSKQDIASSADLENLPMMNRRLYPGQSLIAVQEQSDFCWSDDSWDPMTREIVALFSSQESARKAIALGVVGPGELHNGSSRRAHDFFEVPLECNVERPNPDPPLYVLFATEYLGISGYSDEEGRMHATYRTDRSGKVIKVFTSKAAAEADAARLNTRYRETFPRSPISESRYNWRRPSPFEYGHSRDEWSSLRQDEFDKAIQPFPPYWSWSSNRMREAERCLDEFYRRQRDGTLSDHEKAEEASVLAQLKRDAKESEEECKLFDEQARQLWRIMDRVILFKVVSMSLDDDLLLAP